MESALWYLVVYAGSLDHHYAILPFNCLLSPCWLLFTTIVIIIYIFFIIIRFFLLLLLLSLFFFLVRPTPVHGHRCLHAFASSRNRVDTGHRTEWTFCIVLSLPEPYGARERLHWPHHCSASSFATILALQVQPVPVASFPPSNHYYWYEVFPPEIRRWRVWREGRGRRN